MYPSKPNNTKQKAIATVLTLLAVVVISGSVSAYNHKHSANATVATTTPIATPAASNNNSAPSTTAGNSSSTSTSSSSTYKDGTYTASSDYYVPHGDESIKVTLTVQNGIVTNSQVVNSGNDRESMAYQQEFSSEYKTSVVGKKLADIQLSYVAGASDTTQGFDDALSQIRNQAQA